MDPGCGESHCEGFKEGRGPLIELDGEMCV